MLDLLAQVHDEACAALPELQVHVLDPTECDSLLLYSTLIELAGAIVALHRADKLSGVAAVARSALDAFVDIRNLLRDPEYWRHLEMPDHIEWRRLLGRASAGSNPFLDAMAKDPDFAQMRKVVEEIANQRKTDGATKLRAEERFNRAKLKAEYRSLYALLSAETHNNLSALITRHLVQDDAGAWILDLYSGRAGFGHAVLLSVAEMLMHASNEMHDRFGKGRQRVASITMAVERARAHVQSSPS